MMMINSKIVLLLFLITRILVVCGCATVDPPKVMFMSVVSQAVNTKIGEMIMPTNVGYSMEIVNDPNQFKIGDLKRADDRVSKMSAPSYSVDLDFDEMLQGINGESEPMKLTDAKKSNGKGKKY